MLHTIHSKPESESTVSLMVRRLGWSLPPPKSEISNYVKLTNPLANSENI